jgi:caspase domain-containing protein/von Hippel-Lindau disease tumor suppressor protein
MRGVARVFAISMVLVSGLDAQDRRLTRNNGMSERRFALVVGNDAYSTTPLRNAVADARAIAQVLRDDLGFTVTLVIDARLETFDARLDQFMRQLQPGDVALFYYSGHGVEIDGENYLLPVDFTMPEQQVQVKRRSVSALEVLERMGDRGARIRLVILDACRDNPFRGVRSGAGGLTRMEAQGAMVAYATALGQTASDNPTGTNGLFTRELLVALRIPGLTVPEIFRRVRAHVTEATAGRQFPWLSDGLVGDFVLLPGPTPKPPVPADPGLNLSPTPRVRGSQVRSCDYELRTKSTPAVAPATYSISNTSSERVTVYWLDLEGKRQRWFELTPGQSVQSQGTYTTHPWLVADANGQCWGIFNAPNEIVVLPGPAGQPVGAVVSGSVAMASRVTGSQVRSCTLESSTRSTPSNTAATYSISNSGLEKVSVFWLDYDGARQPWFDLDPGQRVPIQKTYATHPWVIVDAAGRCMGIFNAPNNIVVK